MVLSQFRATVVTMLHTYMYIYAGLFALHVETIPSLRAIHNQDQDSVAYRIKQKFARPRLLIYQLLKLLKGFLVAANPTNSYVEPFEVRFPPQRHLAGNK